MIPILPFKLGNEFLHDRVLLVPEMLLAQVCALLKSMFGSEGHTYNSSDGVLQMAYGRIKSASKGLRVLTTTREVFSFW